MARDDYAQAQGKQAVELPEEFGFNYPYNMNEIRNVTIVLEAFNKWPDDGGYFDQDAKFMDDVRMYKRIKDWVVDQHKPEGDSE